MAEFEKKPHSVKVPRLYKEAAKALKLVQENGEGLKSAVYSVKHPNVKGITALVSETLKHEDKLDPMVTKSKITENEKGLAKQVHLVKILLTELFWGKKRLLGEAKPLTVVLQYKEKFEKILAKIERRNKSKDGGNSTTDERQVFKKPRYVRVNTLKMSVADVVEYLLNEEWIQKQGIHPDDLSTDDFVVDEFVDNVLVFSPGTEFHRHPLYLDGSVVLQDKASCLPALALKPRKGRDVLDACAAPGMKTSYLASLMQNEGSIVAIEKSTKRCETLKTMLEHCGVTCATVINTNFTDIDPAEYPNVEYILVDPSCSGSGMYGRIDAQLKRTSETSERLLALQHCQRKLLEHAMKFPSVKRIVYSTCSIYSQENEDVVASALNIEENYSKFQIKTALPSWPHRLTNPKYSWSEMCVKSDYDSDRTDGFFVAVIERISNKRKNKKKSDNEMYE